MSRFNFSDLFSWLRPRETEIDYQEALDQIKLRWHNQRSDLGLDRTDQVTQSAVRPINIGSNRVIARIRKTIAKFVTSIVRNTYEEPEWDFSEVNNALFKETVVRRAVEKYVEQIWKNGFEFTGKNQNTVKYIRKRFRQIQQVSGITTLQVFQQMAFSIVAYGNLIMVKRRSEKASGGRIRTTFDGKELLPVAAYYVLSPANVLVDKDPYGNPRRWKQRPEMVSLSNPPSWGKDDVIFVKDNSTTDPHFLFAMPMVVPVIPDIRALRETEELALLQAIKFSIPRFHAKVGTTTKDGVQEEVDITAGYIDTLPSDAVIVTSNRVSIESISSKDQVVDLDPYLDYWYSRILAGLGMSKVGMGEGGTANRNTAQVMTSEMQNTTIKFQQILKDAIENGMIRELLLELGYTDETLDETNMVYLHVPEIDLESKIKKENHAVNKFLQNAITHDEMRNEIGHDVLTDEEKKGLFSFMIQQPLAESAAQAKLQAAANTAKNTDSPSNQHGKSMAKPKVAKDMDPNDPVAFLELVRNYLLQESNKQPAEMSD